LIAIYKPLKPNAVVADRNQRFTGGFSSPKKRRPQRENAEIMRSNLARAFRSQADAPKASWPSCEWQHWKANSGTFPFRNRLMSNNLEDRI
jgi:hypothetical protein